MKEDFLHFVWQHQAINSKNLSTVDQLLIKVEKTGNPNGLAGPDFKESNLIIGGLKWIGSVEIHIKSSDWKRHGHSGDPNYENVILHVVYEYDTEILNSDGKPIPTLELKGRIKPGVLKRYEGFINSIHPIPCAELFPKVRLVTKLAMLESALIQRLQRKAQLFKKILEENNHDWEQATYVWLAGGFGFKINSDNMMELANLVPLKMLQKHSKIEEWEALLFGASGLLNRNDNDGYANVLRREYVYLEMKYSISAPLAYNQWHFSGTRPTNFPSIRIAQFTALVHHHKSLFSLFTNFNSLKDFQDLLFLKPKDYWQNHYNFGKAVTTKIRGLSKRAIQGLMINTIAPLLVAFADYKDNSNMIDQAMNVLMALPAEQNHIINKWQELGWNVNSSFDTQGLIELYNEHCTSKKCMNCKIGVELVNH